MPEISIIIPIYNVERYLHQCLDSILAQTFVDFECILVDDCSSDSSSEICDEYAGKDERIKVIHNRVNIGSSLSRKNGFENSSGAYIQFIDSDDWIEIDMVEKMYSAAISGNYDITICDCFYEKNGFKEVIEQKFSGFDKISIIKDIISFRVRTYLCNKLVRRDLLLMVEFPEYSRSEDYVITIQNVCNSKRIGYVNVPLYNYRYNANSLSNSTKNKVKGIIEENRNWYKIINILKEKYEDMKIFEPELSIRLNWLKETYRSENDLKKLKKLNELFELYPKTNFYRWKILKDIRLIKKIIPQRISKFIKVRKSSMNHIIKRLLKNILPVRLILILGHIQINFKNLYINIYAIYKKRQIANLITTLKPLTKKKSPQYIVSLTSYGERLTITAPYAIVTLFDQTIKPDRIILWVANEDKENIPKIMDKLIEKGLEVNFCDDTKSYTKLVPAIENFPEDYIITADDDIFYPRDWFERLIMEHKQSPKKIICHRAHGIKVDKNYAPVPYFKWDYCIEPKIYFDETFLSQENSISYPQLESVFPTGCAGILYPPGCFHSDFTNRELFMKLAPYADDIWFWAMAVININYFEGGSPYVVIKNGYSRMLLLISLKQEKNDDTLLSYNVAQNGNDKQLKAVIEYYPQIKTILRKIVPIG